jgi:signal transduction histidine kinase
MRERVELYQGRLEAGPTTDRRFRVTASIPYREGRS